MADPTQTTAPDRQLADLLSDCSQRCETYLERWLVSPRTPETLAEAMRYCMRGGGKRLRPALVMLAAEAVGGQADDEVTGRAAASVEMLHTYSLVHDDLPAMDDDDLRRGQPSAHVRFGEAMAVLVGDALLTRAFEVLAEAGPCGAALAAELARGAGPAGMIAGQVADMELCELPAGADGLWYIHEHKTAALLRAAARMGGRCGGAGERELDALGSYGETLGLAFQVVDDVLDVTGSAEQLGKTPGKDAEARKRTSVAELGLEGARRRAGELTDRAVAALAPLGGSADRLRKLAAALGRRKR